MREVKRALLEADVNFKVVRDFISDVTERAVGTEVLESLLAKTLQQFIDLLGTVVDGYDDGKLHFLKFLQR